MPMTDKERLKALYDRIKWRRQREDEKQRALTDNAKEVEKKEK